MADIPQTISADPAEMLATGRRHLAVRDYSSAVTCLGKACELLAERHGQKADECGEAYLWYGRSLLGLAREESGVLGDGIPGAANNDDTQEEDEEGENGGGGGDDDEEVDEDNNEEADKKDENKTENSDESKETDENKVTAETEESKTSESKPMEVDTKPEEQNDAAASSSAGPSSSAADEAIENDEDEEVENLQLAWEVFELARDVFLKRGDRGKKELADVYLYLGEVSLESETYDKAILDMSKSLELFTELYGPDDRRIAETHYQIGLAHSLSNGFDEAIENFKKAGEILEARIATLQSPTAAEDPTVKEKLASDTFYSIDSEIKELKELLPEIKEKIQDMMDYKAEAMRSVRESLGLCRTNGSSNQNGSSSSAPEKKALDISHLVKRKRTSEEMKNDDVSAPKKPAP